RSCVSLLCVAAAPPHLPSFPTRRSSDLPRAERARSFSCGETLWGEKRLCGGGPLSSATRIDRLLHIFFYPFAFPNISDPAGKLRSEEHTSELQSRFALVCRLLLEKQK